jgi:non-ribosomal peptide synthetase component F
VLFALQNAPTAAATLGGLQGTPVSVKTQSTHFDLEVHLWERAGRLGGSFVYATDLFEVSTVDGLSRHFQLLLEGIVADPERRLWEFPLLTEAERRQVLVEWNRTETEYPRDETVQALFEAQVERSPQSEAVVFGEDRLTYAELNTRANRLAGYLSKRGVGPEVLVGLCVERSVEMVVGLLGILKAGGAYVPLDPAYPRQRLAFMLEDTGARLVLTQEGLVDRLPGGRAQVIRLDADWVEIARESAENRRGEATAENLAYVLYTSGSTGNPKGVAMPHRALLNLVRWQLATAPNPRARTLQFASLNFDVSFQELFSTWCAGGALVLLPEDVRRDPDALWSLVARESVERLFLPFVALQHLAEAAERDHARAPRLKDVITAGEQLQTTPQIGRLFESGRRRLQNQYGPTESHLHADGSGAAVAGSTPDRPSHRELTDLPAGPASPAGPRRCGGGAVHWRGWSRAGLLEPAGPDGGEVRQRSLPAGSERAPLQDRRPGALPGRRGNRVPGTPG